MDGAFSFRPTDDGKRAGRYIVCLWVAEGADVATQPTSVPVTVGRPLAACVVPRLPHSRRLASVKRRIRSAHCSVGRVRHTRRTHVHRGRVVRLSPKSGRRLRHGARVTIVVSRR